MNIEISTVILAAVTKDRGKVAGGVPIFYAKDDAELEVIAESLGNILDAMVHHLANDTLILVKH